MSFFCSRIRGMLLKLKLHDVFSPLRIQQGLKVKASFPQRAAMYYITFFSHSQLLFRPLLSSSASSLSGSPWCICNWPSCRSLNIPGTLLPQAFALMLPSACGTLPQKCLWLTLSFPSSLCLNVTLSGMPNPASNPSLPCPPHSYSL